MPAERLVALRAFVRDILVGVAVMLTLPLWAATRMQLCFAGGEWIFTTCAELLSLVPGLPGVFLRRGYYCMCLEACATDVSIGFGTILTHPQVTIGRRVYIGLRCTIGMARIEDDVALGSNVDLLSGRRQHGLDDSHRPIQAQPRTFRQVRIGRNAWVGNSSVIMDDVGADSVVGAGSVVVKPVPAGAIAAGNPAVVKKWRAGFEPARSAALAG